MPQSRLCASGEFERGARCRLRLSRRGTRRTACKGWIDLGGRPRESMGRAIGWRRISAWRIARLPCRRGFRRVEADARAMIAVSSVSD